MRKFGIRKLAAVGCVFVLAGGGGVAVAQRVQEPAPAWVWYQGTDSGYVAQEAGSNTLVMHAAGAVDLRASHVRLMSDDGQFVFAHSTSSPVASLNAYYLGTSTRTPIQIGEPNLATTLVVAGKSGQRSDLQQWALSGKTVAAVDGKGRLRLGKVTLEPKLVKGRVMLYALVGSKKQLVAQGAKAR